MSQVKLASAQSEEGPDAMPDRRRPKVLLAAIRPLLVRTPWILWVLVAICLVFSILAPDSFATILNFRNVAIDMSVPLVMAVGATYVLCAAGIDLSIGSVLVLSSVLAARALRDHDVTGWSGVLLALGICLGCGIFWGAVNGVIIAYAEVNPLITTLGTMGITLGLSYIFADSGQNIAIPRNPHLSTVGIGRLAGELPYLVLIALAIATVGGVVLAQTRFGRHTAAIGSERVAAERVGLNVRRHLLKIYILSGVLSGLAGFMSLARYNTTTIDGHGLDILDVMTGVILGGTSLFGGVATMFGTVIGMAIPAVLANGLVILDIQPFWQKVLVGIVLILAVYIDQRRRQRRL